MSGSFIRVLVDYAPAGLWDVGGWGLGLHPRLVDFAPLGLLIAGNVSLGLQYLSGL